MSLYAQYLKEREDCEVLENEFGFLAYRITPGHGCFIRDFFTVPEERGKGHGKALWAELQMLAQKHDCTDFVAQVDTRTKTANESLNIILAHGFRVVSAEENRIFLFKEASWAE